MNELHIVLIMTARTFDLEPAYEAWDKIRARNTGWWTKMSG